MLPSARPRSHFRPIYPGEEFRVWWDCLMEILRPEERYLESYKSALIQSISSGTAAYPDRAQSEP